MMGRWVELNVGGWFGGIKVGAGTSLVTWCNEHEQSNAGP